MSQNYTLIITLGNRDAMFVYENLDKKDGEKKLVRLKVPLCRYFKRAYENIEWISVEKTEEKTSYRKKEKYRNAVIEKITFPMFEKTIKELKKQQVTIDSLYVISTDRRQLLTNLNQIKENLRNNAELLQYINSIISWIERDCSSYFSDALSYYLNRILKENENKMIDKEILKTVTSVFNTNTELNFLKIGENYNGFNKINITNMMTIQNDEGKMQLLSEADFNNEYFFFPALNEKLCRKIYFDGLGKSNMIYISHAGGMPVVQLTLLTILDSEFPDVPKKKIYFPEKQNFSFQHPHIDYSEFFRFKKLIRFYLKQENMEEVKSTIEDLMKMNFIENSESNFQEISELFKEGTENRDKAILYRIDKLINPDL